MSCLDGLLPLTRKTPERKGLSPTRGPQQDHQSYRVDGRGNCRFDDGQVRIINPLYPLLILDLEPSNLLFFANRILGNLPNTYAFTKSLGEALVVDKMETLPVVIMRPSIVIPIYQDPIPGWTDNINGPTGLLIGAGKGVIRTMYCDSGQ